MPEVNYQVSENVVGDSVLYSFAKEDAKFSATSKYLPQVTG